MSNPTRTVNGKKKIASRDYKCVFFDLDHTLWDYECNAREMLAELYADHNLSGRGIGFDDFYQHFQRINLELWNLYDRGLIDNAVIRNERFKNVLREFHVTDDKLSAVLSDEYFHGCPKKSKLIPHAKEVLDYLADHYAMTIITNGFDEIQTIKLTSGEITHYFDHIITSQKAGHKKPAREIFDYALSVNKLQCGEVIMVGDNLATDIGGARNACIDTVFFNPAGMEHREDVSYEISCLSELKEIL